MSTPDHDRPDPARPDRTEVWRGFVEEDVVPADELDLPDPTGWPDRSPGGPDPDPAAR